MNEKVNCIIVDDEPVAREILESHLGKIENFRVIASCKNALEAFQAINNKDVDLIFLDINMPEISGLSFARSISADVKVIFTTAYRDYAVDGFDLKAVDYLLKPISFERLLQAVNKYLDENSPVRTDSQESGDPEIQEAFFVRADRKMIKVGFDEIIYIESRGDYLKIRLEDKDPVITRDTMSNIQARLPGKDFIRTHRSFLVALAKIDSYTNDTIGLGKHEVPISRGFRDAVLKKLEE